MNNQKYSNSSLKDLVFSYDYIGKYLISHKYIIAELVKIILPEIFLRMSDEEIVDNYLELSSLNNNHVDLKSEEINTPSGKKTVFDLHFNVLLPNGSTVSVNIELQRERTTDVGIRAFVYPAKMLVEQSQTNYKDINAVVSAWINLDPLKKDRNTIRYFEMAAFNVKFRKKTFDKIYLPDYEIPNNLERIVQINIGGPEYENFEGIIKFLYDLFHNNQEEVKEYFKAENIQFDLEEVLNPMIEYTTFDEQTRNYYQRTYKKEGFEEGKKEGRKEGKEEGRKEGKEEGKKELKDIIYNNLIKNGVEKETAYKSVFES